MSVTGDMTLLQKVTLATPREQASLGTLRLLELSASTRNKRAAKVLFTLWGLAVVSVFIPLAHFVLVPFFLVAGPVAARFVHATRTLVTEAHAACPACGRPFEIRRAPLRWPIRDVCGSCHEAIVLRPEGEAEALPSEAAIR